MVKKIVLAGAVVLGVLGCSSSSDDGDTLANKKFIHILQDMQPEMCNGDDIADALNLLEMHEYEVRRTSNTTTCESYDKIEDNYFCTIEVIGGGDSNCVVGFNYRPVDFTGYE
jgi:hypothetical protein